ncbi:hypothetical protein DFS34DRAFT_639089 [Phlyctochytrium arcticum]|nr:hypothetical protein DFS34DRAFT_639089 [Phlyctochytrium arcticum]
MAFSPHGLPDKVLYKSLRGVLLELYPHRKMYEVYTGDDYGYAIHRLPKDAHGAPMSMGHLATVLNIIVIIFSIISAFCSGYIVYHWWLIRSRASFNFRILIYTIVAETTFQGACFMGCVLRLASVHFTESSFACQGLGFIILYSVAVMTQWISCVALNSYFAVVRQIRLTSRQELWFHAWCWGSPLVYMTIPFWGFKGGAPQYGFRNEAWCGIRPGTPVGLFLLCMGLFAFPLFVMTFSYGSIIWKIYGNTMALRAAAARNSPGLRTIFCSETADQTVSPRAHIDKVTKQQMSVMWTMVAYLVAYLITWIPALLDFSWELAGHDYITPGWFEIMGTSVCHTTGMVNFFVYSRTHNSAAYKDGESHGGTSQGTKNERSVNERRDTLKGKTGGSHPNVHNGQFLNDDELEI